MSGGVQISWATRRRYAPSCVRMKRTRRRKCLCCGALYVPDRCNAHHQKFCTLDRCREVSRQVSQQRWLAKAANRDYHGKRDHCARVRAWRQAHPGYWRKQGLALQDVLLAQVVATSQLTLELNAMQPAPVAVVPPLCFLPQLPANQLVNPCETLAAVVAQDLPLQDLCLAQTLPLQDLYLSQDPLFVGLISILTDTLQEDMAPMLARLQTRGQAILRNGPGIVQQE